MSSKETDRIKFAKFVLTYIGLNPDNYMLHKMERLYKDSISTTVPGILYINWMVATYYNIDPVILRERKTRKREFVKPRHIAEYIAHVIYNHTCYSVRDFYYITNHSTVLSNCKTVQNLMDTDKKIKEEIDEILTKLKK